jgi:hypothetical protein
MPGVKFLAKSQQPGVIRRSQDSGEDPSQEQEPGPESKQPGETPGVKLLAKSQQPGGARSQESSSLPGANMHEEQGSRSQEKPGARST